MHLMTGMTISAFIKNILNKENKKLRLQKYIADAGVCSRRKAEELIANGEVKVNGVVVDVMGVNVLEEDEVTVSGKTIKPTSKKVYYMLNKPKGYVTTTHDQFGRPCVLDLLDTDIEKRVYPAGRLDYNTEGLLILTNDGDFVNAVIHPSNRIEKKYIAVINGKITEEELQKLEKGVIVDGKKTGRAKAFLSEIFKDKCVVELTITEGRNRQVRKMFEAVGHHVIDLKRVRVGNLELGNLKLGKIRKLNPGEVNSLLKLAKERND